MLCLIEVDDNFDTPQLMDEDVLEDDNGDAGNICGENDTGNEQVKVQNQNYFQIILKRKFVACVIKHWL